MSDIFRDQILVHVGLHKCGSTWMQGHLFAQPEHGFYAPLGRIAAAAVSAFVAADPVSFDAETARRQLEAAAQPRPEAANLITVISHEALSSRPHHGHYYAPTVAQQIRQVFSQPKILLVFREQSKLIYSLYGEHIRNGGRDRLQAFIGTGQEPEGFHPKCRLAFFHFDRLIKMYQDVFGEANVLAMPLEYLAEDPADFTARIFQFCGKENRNIPPAPPAYAGDVPLATEFIRFCNGFIVKDPLSARRTLGIRARQRLVRLINSFTPQDVSRRQKYRIMTLIQGRMGSEFDQSNQRLAAMTGFDLGRYGYRGFSKQASDQSNDEARTLGVQMKSA
ncbi:MAG: sulfotransferase domain-containing protein [Pseudomonadota bacterium]